MNDIRRQQVAEINADPGSREALEAKHGQVWDTKELGVDFDVLGFMAPYVVVRRRLWAPGFSPFVSRWTVRRVCRPKVGAFLLASFGR